MSPATSKARRRARQAERVGTSWDSVEVAAARLDMEPQALRARCRRAAQAIDGHIVAELGMGVIARKLGHSWRVYVPSPEAGLGGTRGDP